MAHKGATLIRPLIRSGRDSGADSPPWAPVIWTAPAPACSLADPWLGQLLPHQSCNEAVLNRIDAREPARAGDIASLFLADPFLDLASALSRLSAAGIAGIAAFPSVTRLREDFGRVADQAGLGFAREAEQLGAAAAAGFGTFAFLWTPPPEGARHPASLKEAPPAGDLASLPPACTIVAPPWLASALALSAAWPRDRLLVYPDLSAARPATPGEVTLTAIPDGDPGRRSLTAIRDGDP